MCDPSHTQFLGREQLYKSLALIGLIQKGKPLDEKIFLNYGDKGEENVFIHSTRCSSPPQVGNND